MRFAIISDIHMGPERFYKGVKLKLTDLAMGYTNEFIDKINQDSKVKFVVQLGDAIDSSDRECDKKNYALITSLLKKLHCPVYHVMGNHEFQYILHQELKALTGYKELYYSFDIEEIHGIVLFSEAVQQIDIRISQEQIDWLKKDLEKTSKKTIVFVHYSLADQDLEGNVWFQGFPDVCLIKNRKDVRNILAESGKVIAVFMGHLHWNKMDMHGPIPFFTIQSLVENMNLSGLPSNSYAIVALTEESIKVDIKGNHPKIFKLNA